MKCPNRYNPDREEADLPSPVVHDLQVYPFDNELDIQPTLVNAEGKPLLRRKHPIGFSRPSGDW
jgi:hypothetical protein